jgi:cytidine deaminase
MKEQLINEAKGILDKRYKKGFYVVGCALKAKSGKIYTGISMNSQKVDICAEWSAITKAISEGEDEVEMIVAVKKDDEGSFEILPPCGLCRELYVTYFPNVKVIISETDTRTPEELLPNAWKKKKMEKPPK